jgi:catechol 2,3-dioxygenase-like lactoylglutathione lyase family enzyme
MVHELQLLVLRCADLDASRRFYAALGLDLREERHGEGPVHWAARVGRAVVELYPADARGPSTVRWGLRVDDIDATRARVAALGAPDHRDGDVCVVVDPDGSRVELRSDLGGEPLWSLWRQDDNGNRFLMNRGLSRADAERFAADFEARAHKQIYWIAPDA